MDKEVFVFIDLNNHPYFVGRLWANIHNGRERATFEYDDTWLGSPFKFSLEPALILAPGPFHTRSNHALFGAIGDSAPDRWGRMLMNREARNRDKKEGKTPNTLMEIDYLLMVNDEVREGALRFALNKNGPFLADGDYKKIPPLINLPKLLSATEAIANDEDNVDDLKLLLAPGSSLGGARPKASIYDKNGNLAIAKFPQKNDDYNVVIWEAIALTLAERAGITVPIWHLEKISIKNTIKPVLILQRFDRVNKYRIPFLSAMSMLQAKDNETHTYLEIVDALRKESTEPEKNIKALWRRVIFNIFISNTDDHLRNHGFLYQNNGWELSPAYDLNPVPSSLKNKILCTPIMDANNPMASLEIALEAANYFGLSVTEAKNIISEVKKPTQNWKQEAKKFGLSTYEIDQMSSAFIYI